MALDPNIPLQAGRGVTPVESPLAAMQQAYALKSTQMGLAEQQREMDAQRALDEAFAGARYTSDGTIDPQSLVGHLPGHLVPGVLKNIVDVNKSVTDLRKTQVDIQNTQLGMAQKQTDLVAGLANGVVNSGYDTQSFMQAIKTAESSGLIPHEQAIQHAVGAIEQGQPYIKQVTDGYVNQSREWQATLAQKTRADAAMESAKKPTEATLAVGAASGDPQAAAAMGLLKPKPAGSLEEQYLTAVTTGDMGTANRIIGALRQTAAAKRDPAAAALAQQLSGLRVDEAKARLDAIKDKAKPLDISPDVQTTTAGRKYVDLSLYGAGERDKAREAANTSGAIPVSKEQAEALQEIDNARMNQRAIITQISDLLPKDPSGRVVAAATVPLAKVFQTNDQIGAFNSWRTAAIQTLRATAGSKGLRINQAEIAQAIENDIPRLTDTLGTAQQKVANINTLLESAERSILVRDRSAAQPAGAGAAPAQAAAPANPFRR